VQEHIGTFFIQVRRKLGSGLSDFVKDEFGAFHGMLAHGFLCLRCTSCAHEKNGWPFSANGMDCAFRAVGNAWRRRLLTWLIALFSRCRISTRSWSTCVLCCYITHIVMSLLEFMQRLTTFAQAFDIDIEHCPRCGETLKIITAILESGAS
jgi:hypothetical protein